MDKELENLRYKVSHLDFLFSISDKDNARIRLENLKIAKQELKEYKAKHFPELLLQPKNNFKQVPFVPMSEWTEKFEEYEKN